MLFGRSRRQAPAVSNAVDTVADDSVSTDQAEPPSSSWEAVKEAAFLPQQAQQHDEGMPSQGSAWQAEYAGISNFASPVPADASPGSAVFVTPSSALLSDAMTNPTPLHEAADKAEVDPLSHRFEQRMLSAQPQPSHVNPEGTFDESQRPPAQQPQPWGGDRGWSRGVATPPEHMRSRAASPSLSDHGSFDPLTATFEEFEAFNRSREKHHLGHLPEQLPDQSSALSNQQLPQQPQQQQLPTAATTSGQPRKTRTIPRIFRLRKTGSTADRSSTSTEAAAAASTTKPVEAEEAPVLPSAHLADPTQAGGPPQETTPGSNAAQAAAVPKPRSKPFGLLRKRSKGTAQTLTSQQSLLPVPVPSEAVPMGAPLPEAGEWGQGGVLGDPPMQPLTGEGSEEQQHVNTVLGLSAGLTNSFGSFMAASAAASPRASPSSPCQGPESAQASKQTLSDQVSTLVVVAVVVAAPAAVVIVVVCCCGCFVHAEDCPSYSRHATDLVANRKLARCKVYNCCNVYQSATRHASGVFMLTDHTSRDACSTTHKTAHTILP